MADKVYVPEGGGGLQGMKCGPASESYYDPLDTKGSSKMGGDWARTKATGGLGHAQVTSKNTDAPKSYFKNGTTKGD